jgi:hypothetical protein
MEGQAQGGLYPYGLEIDLNNLFGYSLELAISALQGSE